MSFLPFGGDNRDRTDDPLLAKQVLSQLSYTPVAFLFSKVQSVKPRKRFAFPRKSALCFVNIITCNQVNELFPTQRLFFSGKAIRLPNEPQKLNNECNLGLMAFFLCPNISFAIIKLKSRDFSFLLSIYPSAILTLEC